MERAAVDGMMTEAGDVLFRLADVSRVWVVADVPEREVGSVRLGSAARSGLQGTARAGRSTGRVDLVYPQVSPETRTVKVRIEIENPDGLLLPDMYADVEIDSGAGGAVVAVPNDAILDTGSRQVVILDRGEGRFEPRPVELGARGTDMTEVVKGVDGRGPGSDRRELPDRRREQHQGGPVRPRPRRRTGRLLTAEARP